MESSRSWHFMVRVYTDTCDTFLDEDSDIGVRRTPTSCPCCLRQLPLGWSRQARRPIFSKDFSSASYVLWLPLPPFSVVNFATVCVCVCVCGGGVDVVSRKCVRIPGLLLRCFDGLLLHHRSNGPGTSQRAEKFSKVAFRIWHLAFFFR